MSTYKDTSLYHDTLPVQKLSLARKDKNWRESCVDAIINRQETTGSGYRDVDLKLLYDLYNGNFDIEDFKYVTNPFNVKDGFPASPQNFNIIKPKIDLLLGEETKRPESFRIIQTNDKAYGEIQKKSKQLLLDFIIREAGIDINDPSNADPLTLEEIQDYMERKYKTVAEDAASSSLEYMKYYLNTSHEFIKGWKDALIAGEEIYYTGIVNGDVYLERLNPIHCDYDRDEDTEFIEDRDWFLRIEEMTPAAVYDRFFDMMDSKDLDKLLDLVSGTGANAKTGDNINSRSIMYREKITDKILREDAEVNSFTIPVYHTTWKSFKKVGFLTYTDEFGETQTTYVDETYKADPDETIEWDWVIEIWEGYRIGEDIYLGIEPLEYQNVSIDNPNANKLPFVGAIYNNTNSKSKSLVAIMKPLQYMYIILWYRLELALARDKGKILNMDITQIPKSMGVDVNKWLHYLTAIGVNLINPYEEGWDIPGREGGRPAAFNQMSSQDLTMSNVIAGYIQLIDKLEIMIGELSGVTKQREGAIHHRELVGNVERSVIQSSHITEPLFWLHNQVKKNTYTSLINIAKAAWPNSKKIHYIMPDGTRKFLEITEDFLYADFDIFLTDSTKDNQSIESLRTLFQPAMQNGASLLDIAEILTSDNLTEIKDKLAKIEKKRMEMAQQQMEAESQAQQLELQIKQEDLRLREEDSIRKAETAINVALINAENKMSGDMEGEDSTIDYEKLDLQKDKQNKDFNIKERQLAEEIRQNRVSEMQKQQEIVIKRQQANKPATTNKSK